MEQGNILPVGANRFGLTTLSDFKDLFVEAKRKSNRLKASQDNGDHSLNPGMDTPIPTKPSFGFSSSDWPAGASNGAID